MQWLDRLDAWAERHKRALDWLGFAWLMLGAAVNAHFIVLPELPPMSERAIFWLGVGVNVVWWAVLRPRIERHRAARQTGEISHG